MICRFPVDFNHPESIGPSLGFSKNKPYEPMVKHIAHKRPNIFRTRTIRVECNLVSGSFAGSKGTRILREIFLDVEIGYVKIDIPINPIYFEIPGGIIDQLELRLCDQNGNLLNFRENYNFFQIHLRPKL